MCFFPAPKPKTKSRHHSSKSKTSKKHSRTPRPRPAPRPAAMFQSTNPIIYAPWTTSDWYTPGRPQPTDSMDVLVGFDSHRPGAPPAVFRSVPTPAMENVTQRHDQMGRDLERMANGMLDMQEQLQKECADERKGKEALKRDKEAIQRQLDTELGRREAERVARKQQEEYDRIKQEEQRRIFLKRVIAEEERIAAEKQELDHQAAEQRKFYERLRREDEAARKARAAEREREERRSREAEGRFGDFVGGYYRHESCTNEPHHDCRACHHHHQRPSRQRTRRYASPPPRYDAYEDDGYLFH